jgi:hypothetical protein
MRAKMWPAWVLIALGLYTLHHVKFGEDLFTLALGVTEVMAGTLAIIHSDA